MISGIATLFIPLNDIGIVNINGQFIGLSFSICGSVIFVGGFLRATLLDINAKMSSQTQPAKQELSKVLEQSKSLDGYQLASEYAETKSMKIEKVIQHITEGKIIGKTINGYWYVETT
jgi:hypothetical protein